MADDRLSRLEQALEREGGDPLRLAAVKRARLFKRSWIEMAEVLVTVRSKKAFVKWGYKDLYEYSSLELHLRPATVDKLTGSYATVQRHAPAVLKRDGIEKAIPSVDAIDYFAKALAETPEYQDEEGTDQVKALKQAVFDDNKSVAILRKTFNPMFFPKAEEEDALRKLEKTRAALRRLEGLLPGLSGVNKQRVEGILSQLALLRKDVDLLISKGRGEEKKPKKAMESA